MCSDVSGKTTRGRASMGPDIAAMILEEVRPCPAAGDLSLEHKIRVLRREDVMTPIIFVGAGTCGLGAGAGKVMAAVQSWLGTHKSNARMIQVGCIGLCAAEPIMDIQLPGRKRVSFGPVTQEDATWIIEEVFQGRVPEKNLLGQHRGEGDQAWDGVPFLDEHPFFKPQTRLVLANCGIMNPGSLEEYVARGGYQALADTLWHRTPDELCDQIERSGLRGRGGGGFPTGQKWKLARKAPGDRKYLICNADEGDPGAFMDRAVIEGDPHRLLEGMAIAAYGMGASKAYVYIRAEYPLAIARLQEAIAAARKVGLLGENILDSGFGLDIIIKQGAGAFVCGEETALIHSIEGKRGMPRPRPPYPAVSGLFGKPTIINNVETLANLPGILAMGVEDFAALGTAKSKGTKVFALSGKVTRTGLVEVEMGTTLRQIVEEIGGGVPDGKLFKAVQIGGPSGGCIPEEHLDLDVDYESLKKFGAMMGSGGLVVMDEDNCMVGMARFFLDFIQRESCGKCIPCREGTRQMLKILDAMTRSRKNEAEFQALQRFQGVVQLEKLAQVIRDTSLCGLGQTAPNPFLSTIRWFRDEYEAHIFERHCPAGECRELLEYRIDPDLCKGCMACLKKCPVEAIMGAKKTPHYVKADKCIGCGTCVDVCRFGAVIAV